MKSAERQKKLKRARALEAKGKLEYALNLYRSVGAHREAARTLARLGKHREAAETLLQNLGVAPGEVGELKGDKRKDVLLAASYLTKAGNEQAAVRLFLSLGEYLRAADLLERSGDVLGAQRLRQRRGGMRSAFDAEEAPAEPSASDPIESAQRLEAAGRFQLAANLFSTAKRYADAGRCLKAAGHPREAAEAYLLGGHLYEAGECFLAAPDESAALDALVRVGRDDPRYREASTAVIRIAVDSTQVSFRLEHFLDDFIRSGPEDERESELLQRLAGLYLEQKLVESAKDVLRSVVRRDPEAALAKRTLDQLEGRKRQPAQVVEVPEVLEPLRSPSPPHEPPPEPPPIVAVAPETPPVAQATSGPAREPAPNVHEASDPPSGVQPPSSGRPAAASWIRPSARRAVGRSSHPKAALLETPPAASRPPAQPSAKQALAPTESLGLGETEMLDSIEGVSETQLAIRGRPFVADPFQVGSVIADRYEILADIGRGGTATVHQVKDRMLDEEIALKLFRRQNHDPMVIEETLARFREELKVCRRLRHKNVVSLYDFGVFKGNYYITMELLRGETLEDALGKPMAIGRGLRYLLQICAGVQAAHDQGIIHRDLKPANLFVTQKDMIKVMDFGIAKNLNTKGVTRAGRWAGTPEYMSPEQVNRFSKVTRASDLYTMGLIAFRMFTGQLAFYHKELYPMLMMQVEDAPQPPRQIRPSIPEALERMILRLLDKEPDNRLGSCREIAVEVKAILKAGVRAQHS